MVIAGFQPFSLLDYPGKSCSIVFTQGCAFRCPYCHNPELIPMQPTTSTVHESTIFQYLADHKKMLDGVCITGGEPTLQTDLPAFIRRVKEVGLLVKLDTNGIHPKMVKELIDEGCIDYFAMDLKHTWEKYDRVIRVGGTQTVAHCRETFALIQNSGVDHEFRTTICPGIHTEQDFFDMVGYLKGGERYFIQETQFKIVLDPSIAHDPGFTARELAGRLKQHAPTVTIEAR
jgi:pyruvate formate lyase activating enzyme